jgi:hypothetical protein
LGDWVIIDAVDDAQARQLVLGRNEVVDALEALIILLVDTIDDFGVTSCAVGGLDKLLVAFGTEIVRVDLAIGNVWNTDLFRVQAIAKDTLGAQGSQRVDDFAVAGFGTGSLVGSGLESVVAFFAVLIDLSGAIGDLFVASLTIF